MASRHGARELTAYLFEQGVEQRVEVNQRALIDKILARYSAEFSVFRELIQNANDAHAETVEIVLQDSAFVSPSNAAAAAAERRRKAEQRKKAKAAERAGAEAAAAEERRRRQEEEAKRGAAAGAAMGLWRALGWGGKKKKKKHKHGLPSPTGAVVPHAQHAAEEEEESDEDEEVPVHCMATMVTVRNNGRVFARDDWARIKEIASGNPNTESCGMFGVGFYSVFSVAEQPIVRSGDTAVVFHWHGNQLVATQGNVPPPQPPAGGNDADGSKAAAAAAEAAAARKWTEIVLEARDGEPVPFDLTELRRFLVQSLMFTVHVRHIRLLVNDVEMLHVSKEPVPEHSYTINVPALSKRAISALYQQSGRFMTLSGDGLQVEDVAVTVRLHEGRTTTYRMKQIKGDVCVHWRLVPKFEENMQRMLKKSPPTCTTITLVYNMEGKPASFASASSSPAAGGAAAPSSATGSFFASVVSAVTSTISSALGTSGRPCVEERVAADLFLSPDKGRIFIGFPTSQILGAGFSLGAALVPTVERENLDLNDPILASWNVGLLTMAGYIARAFYDHEMFHLCARLDVNKLRMLVPHAGKELVAHVYEKNKGSGVDHCAEVLLTKAGEAPATAPDTAELASEHTRITTRMRELLQAHAFSEAHPIRRVGDVVHTAFFESHDSPLVPSSRGVVNAHCARLPHNGMEQFVKLPMIDDALVQTCKGFFQQLSSRGYMFRVQLSDLVDALKSRVLTLDETVKLLTWFGSKDVQDNVFQHNVKLKRQLLHAVHFKFTRKAADGSEATLTGDVGHMRYWVRTGAPLASLPLPPTVMPDELVKMLTHHVRARACMLQELRAEHWWQDWARTRAQHLFTQPAFVPTLLEYVARYHSSAPRSIKADIVKVLSTVACMPTDGKPAMARPCDVYLPSVDLFDDILHVRDGVNLPRPFLKEIGVRDVPDLRQVLARLDDLQWDTRALLAFLQKHSASFSNADWKVLKSTAFLPAVKIDPAPAPASAGADGDPSVPKPVVTALGNKRARDLFLPDDLLMGMGLTMVAWKGKLRAQSEIGKFLLRLGVTERPSAATLLEKASTEHNPDRASRQRVLRYVSDNINTLLRHERQLARKAAELSIFPTTVDGKTSECKTSRCYLHKSPFHFPVVDGPFADLARKLGVAEHPPIDTTVRLMLKHPPSLTNACEIFEYMALRMSDIPRKMFDKLRDTRFVPVAGTVEGTMSLCCPHEVFIRSSENVAYGNLLDYVDYVPATSSAIRFLAACGVATIPDATKLARNMIAHYERYIEANSLALYLRILAKMSTGYTTLPGALQKQLANTPLLPAYRSQRDGKGDGKSGAAPKESVVLRRARDIVLVDNERMAALFFNLCRAPQVEMLENMYHQMGAPWLSTTLREQVAPMGTPQVKARAKELQERLHERKPLLVRDMRGQPRQGISKHAPKRIDALRVHEVERIVRKITCGNETVEEETTCTITAGGRSGGGAPVMYLSPDVLDYFDIGAEMCKLLFDKEKDMDTNALQNAMILQTPLELLRRKGWPIDRLLVRKKKKAEEELNMKDLKLAGEDKLKAEQKKKKQQQQQQQARVAVPPPAAAAARSSPLPQAAGSDKLTALAGGARAQPRAPLGVGSLQGQGGAGSGPPPVVKHKAKSFWKRVVGLDDGSTAAPAGTSTSQSQRGGRVVDPGQSEQYMNQQVRDALHMAKHGGKAPPRVHEAAHEKKNVHFSCETVPESDLTAVGNYAVPLYVERKVKAIDDAQHAAAAEFSAMLRDLGAVYDVNMSCVNMFLDVDGNRSAFNRNCALFFNLRHFMGMHQGAPRDSLTFWFVVFAHELAHNLHAAHAEDHEALMEMLIAAHVHKLMEHQRKLGLV